jgi:hypothetical protein
MVIDVNHQIVVAYSRNEHEPDFSTLSQATLALEQARKNLAGLDIRRRKLEKLVLGVFEVRWWTDGMSLEP